LSIKSKYATAIQLNGALLEGNKASPADFCSGCALGTIQAVGHPLPEELLNKVDARYRSSDGEWIGITGRCGQWTTHLVKPAELPNSIFGFTNRKWKLKQMV